MSPAGPDPMMATFCPIFFGLLEFKLRFLDMIDQKPLEMADGDGPILFDPLAFPLTGMRAGIGKDSGEGKFFPDEFKGLLELARRDEGNISLGIDMERAGRPAGRSSSLLDSIGARHGLGKELVDSGPGDQSLFIIVRNS